uniref:Uncharacterized protein n=1 Tax=Anguilla anguilla TaxID=7936 RepID=A0A0E9SLY8_ANGAN
MQCEAEFPLPDTLCTPFCVPFCAEIYVFYSGMHCLLF